MRKLYFFFASLFLISTSTIAQDFSNKGKDFWLGYGYHVRYVTGNPINGQDMVLYFATENTPGTLTNIKIEIPALGYVENINNVAPGSIAESQALPKSGSQDARLTAEGLFNSGIHVTSDRPVVAYAHIYNGNVSGATLLFPTNTLGKEYYSINYTQVSNEGSSNSFFYVVAADTGTTTVEITPSAATTTGQAAGVPFNVTLTQGQIYNVMGALTGGSGQNFTGVDLTGSRIRSVSTGDIGCKKIAVFSGAGKMKISCGSGASSDNLIAQAFPKSAWGKKFLTAPTQNMPFNYFRIAVTDPLTVVKVDGVVQTGLVNNFYYDLPLTNQAKLIESDQPIMVAQYITTSGTCGNNFLTNTGGDPDMIYLSPVEQTIDEVIVNSTFHANITEHWINVILKTSAVPSFTITGALSAPNFQLHPQDANFSYAQISVSQGSHTLKADSGFNAIAYGYGMAESYAYNAGTNLKDIYNFVIPLNPLNISGTNSACACTPFFYTVTYPFQPVSLFWDFKGFQSPNVTVSSPVADSTYLINGKQVWQYRLPTPYVYCPAGNYPISITAGTSGSDGCGNLQTKDDTLFVRNTPVPDFNWTNNGCVTDSVYFNDLSTYDFGTFSYKWRWEFGDGDTSIAHNPVHKYATAGRYVVKFSLTTNIGCISAVHTDTVTVTDLPIAKFGISTLLCEGNPVTFSDSSVVFAPGTIQKWYWDFGNGIKDTSLTNASKITSYTPWGSQTASLIVVTQSGCTSLPASKTFVINPNPVAKFALPASVCLPYDAGSFTDQSTIADGTQAGFKWLWHFGEPTTGVLDSSIIQNPSHLYGGVGPFSITLKVTSAAGCAADTVMTLRNIYPKASSAFTVNAENCLSKVSNFASTSNGQGNAITNYYWDFGDATPIGSGQNATHTYAIADTFLVKHWIRTDKGCYSDTITKQVIVNPLPVAKFNYSQPSCAGQAITISDSSTTSAGNITTWTWNFGTGRPDSIINNNTPFSFTYPIAGSYPVSLLVETDKGCKNAVAFSKTILVNVLPQPGYISPEVCLSDASAIFIDSSKIAVGSISSWNWNFGDPASGAVNNVSNLQNPTHRYNAIGTYTATLTVTSSAGCVLVKAQSFTVNGDIPVANFNPQNATALCANDSVAIVDASSVNFGNVTKVEIYWDNTNSPTIFETDDLPVFNKTYKHLYPVFQSPLTKTFSIRYRAYSGTTCVNDRIKTVTVNAVPKLQFVTIPDICLDAAPYQLTQATETGGVPGTGVFSGPGVSATGLFTASTVGAGTYRLRYFYTSAFGCVDSAFQNIKVLAPPVAKFGITAPYCETRQITFTDSSSTPAGTGTLNKWVWNFGDGTPDSVRTTALPIRHAYTVFGSYPVTLTITTSNGCSVSKALSLQVNPLARISFTPSDTLCLPNALAKFSNTSSMPDGTTNALTYLWDFGDASSGTDNTSRAKEPSHLFSTVGPYNIKLTVTTGAGCVNDTIIPLTTIHLEPTADFSRDSVSICQTQFVQFKDISNGAGSAVNKWNWNFDNGQTSTQQVPPAQTYSTAGPYSIVLDIQNVFGCKATAKKPFTVYAFPLVNAGADTVLLEGGQLVINASASGSGLSYLWSQRTNPGNATYLINNTVLRPTVSGLPDDILYRLTVVAAGGCKSFDEVFVTVLKSPVIPNTFTPNGDQYNPNWTIKYLDSYPDCRIQVFDRYGQIVYDKKGYTPPGWDGTYKGKSLPFGTYYYVIEPGSGRKPLTGYVTIIK